MDTLCIATTQTDVSVFGPDHVEILADISDLPDAEWDACPEEWRGIAAHLNVLLQDHGLPPEMAAICAGVPASFVATYASARRI